MQNVDAAEVAVRPHGGTIVGEIVYGSIAGVIGKYVEFPFDTIKVRLQTQPLNSHNAISAPTFTGPMDVLRQTLRKEGFLGLYKGISAPLVGAMIENSGLFLCYSQIQLLVRATNAKTADNANAPLSLPQLAACGFLSGAIVSLVLTPIELIKCKLQVQGLNKHVSNAAAAAGRGAGAGAGLRPTYSGPLHIVRTTLRAEGVAGFYRGHVGTFLRESGGGAAWFGTYEYVCKEMVARSADPRVRAKDDLSPWQLMGAGAVAGMVRVLLPLFLRPSDSSPCAPRRAAPLAALCPADSPPRARAKLTVLTADVQFLAVSRGRHQVAAANNRTGLHREPTLHGDSSRNIFHTGNKRVLSRMWDNSVAFCADKWDYIHDKYGSAIQNIRVGYSGGSKDAPSYSQVCNGDTFHAEVVHFEVADAAQVSYDGILDFFFRMHDPTTVNRQGGDTGTQYRSVIFYHSDDQKDAAERALARVQPAFGGRKVVTTVEPFRKFWDAEEYHQDYLAKNPHGYECATHFERTWEKIASLHGGTPPSNM
ncbi:hypothetical protein HDU82_004296 [Entophlyctis luteolus]|nr:hypothetical protein HDU82_004296 [Entophlyctis luteolus]